MHTAHAASVQAAAQALSCRAAATLEELLCDPAVDVVDICTPNHTHFSVAKEALAAKKAIYMEKPLCVGAAQARELAVAASLGITNVPLDGEGARALEPSLAPVFRHAVHWTGAMSVSNPLALTRAYAARFAALGGVTLNGDARTLHRADARWRVDTASGPLDAGDVVVALGPWAPDLLDKFGIKLPLAVKRGYHRHFRARGNASLSRPVLDAENGY